MRCCHFCLDEGKMRVRVGERKCGSYIHKSKKPKRAPRYQDVPMSQWGLGGYTIVRRGER